MPLCIQNLGFSNIIVKEEFKNEDDEYGVMKEHSEGHKDPYKDMEPPDNRNLPDRSPRTLYSQDSPQDDQTTLEYDQVGGIEHLEL